MQGGTWCGPAPCAGKDAKCKPALYAGLTLCRLTLCVQGGMWCRLTLYAGRNMCGLLFAQSGLSGRAGPRIPLTRRPAPLVTPHPRSSDHLCTPDPHPSPPPAGERGGAVCILPAAAEAPRGAQQPAVPIRLAAEPAWGQPRRPGAGVHGDREPAAAVPGEMQPQVRPARAPLHPTHFQVVSEPQTAPYSQLSVGPFSWALQRRS